MSLRVFAIATLATLALGPSAHAMYLTPDLVQVPIGRLVTNLERDLAAAPDAPTRVRLLVALGRLHAAAWVSKTPSMFVARRVTPRIAMPVVVQGTLTPAEAEQVIVPFYDERRRLLSALAQPSPLDPAFHCNPARVAGVLDTQGQVTLRFTTNGAKDARLHVAVHASTLDSVEVERCLVAKAARFAPWSPHAGKVVVDVRISFTLTEGGGAEPFVGFDDAPLPDPLAPFAPSVPKGPTPSEAALAAAKAHLEAAQIRYEEAAKAAPESAVAHLGLGWTLEQLGRKADAIAAYRKAFALAWAAEKDLKHLGLGARPIAIEAGQYLQKLLDPKEDQKEIAALNDAASQLASVPRPITPIVIPLAADARLADVVDAHARVAFDLDGTGRSLRWGWPTPRAAWLAFDRTGAGQVHSALQLFGSASFLCPWDDGYQALAALDDDGDGELAGLELRGLALWIDADSDGVSDPGEVRPVTAHGIRALSTRASRDPAGVLGNERGVRMADGSTRPSWDWVVAPAPF